MSGSGPLFQAVLGGLACMNRVRMCKNECSLFTHNEVQYLRVYCLCFSPLRRPSFQTLSIIGADGDEQWRQRRGTFPSIATYSLVAAPKTSVASTG